MVFRTRPCIAPIAGGPGRAGAARRRKPCGASYAVADCPVRGRNLHDKPAFAVVTSSKRRAVQAASFVLLLADLVMSPPAPPPLGPYRGAPPGPRARARSSSLWRWILAAIAVTFALSAIRLATLAAVRGVLTRSDVTDGLLASTVAIVAGACLARALGMDRFDADEP
jgi:hypothetical protein